MLPIVRSCASYLRRKIRMNKPMEDFGYIIKSADGKFGRWLDDFELIEGSLSNATIMFKALAERTLKNAIDSAYNFGQYVKKFLDDDPNNLWNGHNESNEQLIKELEGCKLIKVRISVVDEE
jgi:hypothetical protein